ncbi:AAA family ATPase, partial [Candidatus Phytoplasma meliae]
MYFNYFKNKTVGFGLIIFLLFLYIMFNHLILAQENAPKEGINTTTFEKVAGAEEEKQLLKIFIDFLQNPQKYKDSGAQIPKGILLYGPPGTGKTLLAKALAGEAGVPFFSYDGTDFVQTIHGASAKKVKKVFEEALQEAKNKNKNNSPKGSIIFIDEIDFFGTSRNDFNQKEKEVLTAFLTEMDGFKSKEQTTPVIVIATTNRFESLDSALLRPGR